MNYFEVFELPQLVAIDTQALEKKFHGLSRQYHPDYFTMARADEKSRALRMTALLNDAYRTLRDSTRRVEYLLSLHGLKSDANKVPQSLLMEVFDINEQLEEFKVCGKPNPPLLERLKIQVQSRRERFDSELEVATRQWDELVAKEAPESERREHLSKLAKIVSESSYIRNLEDEIENRQGHYHRQS